MNKICALGIAAMILGAPSLASAYSANITLHTPAQKQASDDLVVIDKTVTADASGCLFYSNDASMVVCQAPAGSMLLYLGSPNLPGFDTDHYTRIDGLDQMASASTWTANAAYHLRVAFTTYFTWVEVSKPGATSGPVYDTVFFNGPSSSQYNWYMDTANTSSLGYVYYSQLSSLRDDVQNNYANWAAYPTDVPSGVFLFGKNTGVAMFSSGPGAND